MVNKKGWKLVHFLCVMVCLTMRLVKGNVVLVGRNFSKSFDAMEASFTPEIKRSGENGVLYVAEPLDACSPLINTVVKGSKSSFALIIRGGCSFDDKVRSAQNAGFFVAIIYDNEDDHDLVAMAGTEVGIKIHAVFISKASGKVLKKYVGHTDTDLWIIPTFEDSTCSIMVVSFLSLIAVSSVVATCFLVRRNLVRHERTRSPQVQEFHGMSLRSVKAMPSLIFTTVLEDNCTSMMCAICLEDYHKGEKLRLLPCHHKFHAICVDSWLTAWRTFCPVCKHDARTSTNNPPASESTPLLSSAAASPSSTIGLLSRHSSLTSSLAIPIVSAPTWSLTNSRTHSLSATSHMVNSYKSYNNSTGVCITSSSLDFRNLSSCRSNMSHLLYRMSPSSLGLPLSSPFNSSYMSPYIPCSSNASPSYLVRSSGCHSYLRHCESGAGLSAFASSESLPGC